MEIISKDAIGQTVEKDVRKDKNIIDKEQSNELKNVEKMKSIEKTLNSSVRKDSNLSCDRKVVKLDELKEECGVKEQEETRRKLEGN